MAKLSVKPGTTSFSCDIFIQDSSVTTGAGLTGLAFNTGSLTAYYRRTGGSAIAITLATQTATGAYSSGGFVAVDGTNMPGVYRLDIPDAALATGARACIIMLKGATNMSPCVLEIDLNAEVNVTHFNGTAGTFASGRPEVNTTHIAGSAVSTSTAQIGVNVVNWSGNALSGGTGLLDGLGVLDRGTAQSVTGTTIVLRSAAAFADSELIGATVYIKSATTGAGQSRVITAYTGSTDTATVDTWTTTPTGTIVYEIYAGSPASSTLVPNVNVAQISGDSVAADSLEALLDGTGGVGLSAAAVTITGGVTITQSTTNGHGISVAGNGTGNGINAVGGATGNGIRGLGGATSGDGIVAAGQTSGHGLTVTGVGTTKHGINAAGGSTTSHGISATGGGVGHGILATSGGGATGDGIRAIAASTNGAGLQTTGTGTGAGMNNTAGATGQGQRIIGGSTSGAGVAITTTSGDGFQVLPTAGNALTLTGNGTSKHGLVATGGTAGTSDGISAVAGTGGVAIRGAITGDITGNLSGSVGSVTGAVGSVAGNVGGNVGGSVGSVVGAVGSVTGNVGGNVLGSVASVTAVNDKTGYTLSASGVDAIWDELQSGHTTAGTFGKFLDSAVSGVSTGGLAVQDIVDGILNEPVAAHAVSGSVGANLADTNGDVNAIRSKTDNLTFSTAGKVDANTTNINGRAISGTEPPFS